MASVTTTNMAAAVIPAADPVSSCWLDELSSAIFSVHSGLDKSSITTSSLQLLSIRKWMPCKKTV